MENDFFNNAIMINKKKKLFLSMLLLLAGVSMQAQSIANEQMDERFNDGTKFPPRLVWRRLED